MPTLSLDEASLIIDNAFERVVGQDNAKEKLKRNILAAIRDNGFVKCVCLIGEPGTGKTKLLKIYSALLQRCLGRRPLFYNTGEALGTRTQWVEDDLVPRFNDKDAALVIDEVHEAKKPNLRLMRDMMNPTAERADHTTHAHGDYSITFQPSRHSIAIGTNKVDLLDPALLSRFERIDLALYTDEEMEQILFAAMNAVGIRFSENTLRTIAECNRGTARDVIHWQDSIRQHLAIAGKNTVNRDDVREIIRLRETYPLGVTASELRTLLIIEKHGEQQLKELAAKNGCESKEQVTYEKYLLRRGLLAIEGKRKLTPACREYLKTLRRHRFIAPLDADETED